MISVVLASRLAVIREGMKRILLQQEDIDIVGEVARAQEMVINERMLQADIVVVAHPSNIDGEEYLCFLRRECPSLRIIIIARVPTALQVFSALRNGARGLLSTRCSVTHLPAAIRSVSAGNVYMHEDVSCLVAQNLGTLDRDHTHHALTQREFEVFLKLAGGERVTEIGRALGISAKTVSTHKTRIMEKMGMRSMSQLVQYAIVNRLFSEVKIS